MHKKISKIIVRTMLKKHITSVLWIIVCLLIKPVNAIESHNKFWTVNTIIGTLSEAKHLNYYLEQQIRLIDDKNKFNQFLFLPGLGYQINRNILFFSGVGWIFSKDDAGKINREYRLWEQISWRVNQTNAFTIDSRTRLEERKNSDFSSIAVRLRERVWVRMPFKNRESFFLSIFDEFFFNLNHPKWHSSHFLEQNRSFIGIGKNVSQSTTLDLGYLTQSLFTSKNQLNHVLLISLSVTL